MSDVRVLVIDNYDSFTYNLVQMLGELGARVDVYRNDAIDAAAVDALAPDAVVLSPGPCTPAEAGCSVEVVRRSDPQRPLLGVCLGHQAIAAAFGARVVRGPEPVHGKPSPVYHDGTGLLAGLPSPLEGGRYHSLVVERASLPPELEVCAWTADGLVMGLRHRHRPVFGLQFHPESVLTPAGRFILARFLAIAGERRRRREAAGHGSGAGQGTGGASRQGDAGERTGRQAPRPAAAAVAPEPGPAAATASPGPTTPAGVPRAATGPAAISPQGATVAGAPTGAAGPTPIAERRDRR